MSRVASYRFCTAVVVANLLCCRVGAYCALTASSGVIPTPAAAATAATEGQPLRRIPGVRGDTSQAVFPITPPVVADGKVDVFLDLACPDSAAAWTTIKQVVWDYSFRTEFVFHILPLSQNQVVFDAAKALQILRMDSDDSDGFVLFIDAMLDHQNLILDEHDDEVARLQFFEEVLVKGAVSQGRFTEDQFKWWMKDPQLEQIVRDELESAASLGVRATPTVSLNGIHMMHLVGADQLANFDLFVGRGMSPQPLYHHAGGGELSVWPSVEGGGGGAGGEGAAGHGSDSVRSSGLGGRGELPRGDKAISVSM